MRRQGQAAKGVVIPCALPRPWKWVIYLPGRKSLFRRLFDDDLFRRLVDVNCDSAPCPDRPPRLGQGNFAENAPISGHRSD